MPIRHRLAGAEDAPALHALRRDAILALAPAALGRDEAETWAHQLSLEAFAARLGHWTFQVAERDGRLVGWGAIDGDRIEGLYTAPDQAGTGVGGTLLAELEDMMRARGAAIARLAASANAASFYARRGYRATGPADAAAGLPMAKSLAP